MNSHELFTNTPPRRLFFFAAVPGAVSMLASALYQLFDGMFVGRFLGSTPFAALNLAMPFVIINFALADLIGVGSSVPISIHLGRHEDEEADNYFTCATILIVLCGAVVGAGIYLAAPLLIAAMGAQGEFAELAVTYLRVYGLCSPVTTIVFAVDNFLRICGKTRGSMWLNIFMSALSVGLEALFLLVFDWGIAGAALGTCLGMAITAVVAYVPFLRGKMLLRFRRPRLSREMLKKIVVSGAPNFLNNIAGRITSILMNVLLVRLGGEIAVSIYGVLMYVEGLIQPLLYGMCDSLQPAVGYNWGAGAFGRVKAIEKYCFSAAAVISLLSALAIYLFPAGRRRGRDRGHSVCAAAVQPDVSDALVLVRHAELHAGHRTLRRGDADLRVHGAAFPGPAGGRALAAGPDRPVAELRGDLAARGRALGGGHAAAQAPLEGADGRRRRGGHGARLSRSEREAPPHSMALCGGACFCAAAEVKSMRIPWEMVAAFAIGLGLMCLVGYLLLVPMRFLWRLAAGGVLGAVALLVVNGLGSFFGLHVEVNPFTALAVGFLGLPGAVLVVLMNLLI